MGLDAIVFDLGNTLIPWGDAQTRGLYGGMRTPFERACGPMSDYYERAFRARDALITERENGSLREVTVEEFAGAVCGHAPPPGLPEEIAEAAGRAFLDVCTVPDGLGDLLDRLGRRRPLAVLSNFFLTDPVHELLRAANLLDRFVHVEVSATTGWMKPHGLLFEIVRARLGTRAERTLMVGDDFFADIVGGHRAGFATALTREFRRGPTSDARAPEVSAGRILEQLGELED